MSAQLIRITHDVEIPYLTYSGQPVLTFAQIDDLHGKPKGSSRKRFSDNRKRFIENEDFYALDSQGLSVLRTDYSGLFSEAAQHAILITESGYLMLTKVFNDDRSWQIQRQLVKLYFRVKAVMEPVQTAPINEALERMSGGDLHNLTRLVWLCTHSFRFKNAFVYAIWSALRAVTGTPSPQRFAVQQIPTLAAEIRRIYSITRALLDRIADAERTAARRIFRHGENAEKVLAEIERELAKAHRDDRHQINGHLTRWGEAEIAHFVERRPSGGALYPESQEPLALR